MFRNRLGFAMLVGGSLTLTATALAATPPHTGRFLFDRGAGGAVIDDVAPGAAPAGDVADGLDGGPGFWEVYSVGGGDSLNFRAGPSLNDRVIGKFDNGDVLRNRGCKMSGKQRWCRVEPARGGRSGWVAGRYLREAAGPSTDATVAVDVPVGNGQPFNAAGEVRCSLDAGQPTTRCRFGVVREAYGNAGVWIDMNGGGERYFLFKDGKPVHSDGAAALSFEKSGDLYLLRVGGEERYEIPEAVIFGG